MKRFNFLFIFFIFQTIQLQSQITYTANDQITPYDGVFRPGVNPGYYGPNWNDFLLTDIAGGNPAAGTQGAGARAFRSSLPESIALIFDYPTWVGIYDYYELQGMKDNTMIVGFAHPDHADPVEYCDGIPTEMFANLYEPIFDGGLNGTPVNENNYFARYMWDLLESVGDHVKFWEIWNEPGFDYTGATGWLPPGQLGNWWENNPDPCDYKLRAPIFHFVRTLRVAYEVIKTHSPDDYVVFSGSGFESFLDAVLRNTDNPIDGSVTADYPLGGGAYFDVIGGHYYPHFDGTMRQWNNSIGGFEYFRHSDRGADGLIDKRVLRDGTLAGYGYDGITYPKKIWTLTEYNVPNAPFPDFNNTNEMFFGSVEGARNFIMKSFVVAMKEGFVQIHPYQLGERATAANSVGSFDQMGFFENLNVVTHFNQVILEQGIGYKTTTDMLFEKEYDAAKTTEMNIPANMNGGAFKNSLGQYTYVLWAKTTVDQSEFASASYTFPASMNIGNLDRMNWDFGYTGITSNVTSQNIQLDASPTFFIPNSNTPVGEITLNCPIDSVDIGMVVTLQEGGQNFSWTAPTATTTCPLGGLTITQVSGPTSGSYFAIGGEIISYHATDACGNVVECSFRVNVGSTSGGIGDSITGCHASRAGFNFIGNYKGHKYFVSKEPMTYAEGLAKAAGHGGYLVSINTPEENAYLSFWNSDQAFIGLNDVAQEGTVVWDDGSPVNYTNYDPCSWCESNTTNNDAVEFHPWNGMWSWIPATDVRKVIMEIPCAETLGCGCDTDSEPVCGTDGNTYINACEAECAGVFNYAYGACGGTNFETYFATCPDNIIINNGDPAGPNNVSWIVPEVFSNCPDGYTLNNNGWMPGMIFGTGVTIVTYSLTNECNTIVETCSFTVTINVSNPSSCGAPETLAGFTTLGKFGISRYYLSDETAQPAAAQATAESLGGYLVTINNGAENQFLQQNISELVYIGLNDVNAEGELEWFNGQDLNYNNIDPCDFCNENSAELDYVVMQPWDGAWSFSSQWNSRKYIVEIPCGSTVSPGITIFNCPSDIFIEGQHSTNYMEMVSWDIPTATTDCPGGIVTVTQLAGGNPGQDTYSPTPSGHPIVYEFTDACGNTEQCLFFIYVDPADPIYECPTDITVEATSGTGAVVTYDDPTLMSYCDADLSNYQVITGLASGSEFPIGTTTVQLSSLLIGGAAYCQYEELCSFTVTVIDPSAGGCPQDIAGFTTIGEFGGSKYYLSNDISRPTDAQFEASTHGGYLAVISSQAENDFIQQNISEMVYIGLDDFDQEGILEWINDEPLTYNNVDPCGFCNENSADMDFVIMAPWNGAWSFSNFYNQRLYVMEIPCTSAPQGIQVDCQDIFVEGLPGNPEQIVEWDIPTATTDCADGGLTITQTEGPASGATFFLNIPEVITYSITDACGNTETCSFTVQIENWFSTISITCPDDIIVTAGSDGTATVTWDLPIVDSECPFGFSGPTQVEGFPSGSEFSVGEYSITYIASENNPGGGCTQNTNCSFTVTVLPEGGNANCPTSLAGFTALGEFGGSAYFLSDDITRPLDAEAIANQNGGHLVTINSQGENDFIFQQINELVYIGLTDYYTEGTLEWFDNSALNYTNFDICNFCNENSADMDFVVMHGWNGGWSWSNFYNQRRYVIEIPCSSTSQNLNF
ncbi:MAG: lectin-like protein, partial [Bacteroidota bacterium]